MTEITENWTELRFHYNNGEQSQWYPRVEITEENLKELREYYKQSRIPVQAIETR